MGFSSFFERQSLRPSRHQRLQSQQSEHVRYDVLPDDESKRTKALREANHEYESAVDRVMEKQQLLRRNNLAERDSRMSEADKKLEDERARLNRWLTEQNAPVYQSYKTYEIDQAELERTLRRLQKSKDSQLAAMVKWHENAFKTYRKQYTTKGEQITAECQADMKRAKASLQSTRKRW